MAKRDDLIERLKVLDPDMAAAVPSDATIAAIHKMIAEAEARVRASEAARGGASSGESTVDHDDDEALPAVAPVASTRAAVDAIARGAGADDESLDAASVAADDEAYRRELLSRLPEHERGLPGAEFFAEACVAYGINPDPNVEPREVLSGDGRPRWSWRPGNRAERRPDRIAFVTAGGQKILHPGGADPEGRDFERRLRRVFRTLNPKLGKDADLPADLTFPRTLVTGEVPKPSAERGPVGYIRRRAQAAARGR